MFGLYCAAHVYNLSHEWANQIMSLKPNSYFSPWILLSSRMHLKVCFNWNWNVNLEAQSALRVTLPLWASICFDQPICNLQSPMQTTCLSLIPTFKLGQRLSGLCVTNIRTREAHFLSLHHASNLALFLFSARVHTFMCCLTFVTHHAY